MSGREGTVATGLCGGYILGVMCKEVHLIVLYVEY